MLAPPDTVGVSASMPLESSVMKQAVCLVLQACNRWHLRHPGVLSHYPW